MNLEIWVTMLPWDLPSCGELVCTLENSVLLNREYKSFHLATGHSFLQIDKDELKVQSEHKFGINVGCSGIQTNAWTFTSTFTLIKELSSSPFDTRPFESGMDFKQVSHATKKSVRSPRKSILNPLGLKESQGTP